MDENHSGDSAAGDQLQIKPIAGYPGYFINSEGEVWSEWVTQRWQQCCRNWRDNRQWRPLALHADRRGRLSVNLNNRHGRKKLPVDQLVLETFVGHCPEGMVCRHLNGQLSDNSLANLAWRTQTGEQPGVHRQTRSLRQRSVVRGYCALCRAKEIETCGPAMARTNDEHQEVCQQAGCLHPALYIIGK